MAKWFHTKTNKVMMFRKVVFMAFISSNYVKTS